MNRFLIDLIYFLNIPEILAIFLRSSIAFLHISKKTAAKEEERKRKRKREQDGEKERKRVRLLFETF